MRQELVNFLKEYKQKTVTLAQLAKRLEPCDDYLAFAEAIELLQKNQILEPIAASGTNQANPPLALKFRLKREKLRHFLVEEIRKAELTLYPLIQLDRYYQAPEEVWLKEKPWLDPISDYLKNEGLPKEEASVWERSYALMGNEKWLTDEGGRECLKRIGLYDLLKIRDTLEPLAFSLNPQQLESPICYHLIVENKTTFAAMMDFLPETDFLTVIYGEGKSHLKSIRDLARQLHLTEREHKIFYFGDLDYEGILIWHTLNQRIEACPAWPFYLALLQKPFTKGKQNQKLHEEALNEFLQYFEIKDQERIKRLFNQGGYYPQEALSYKELQEIVRTTEWKTI